MNNFSSLPLWSVGFRPFFSLTILAGLLLPVGWVLIYAGILPAPSAPFSPVQWHAHEMFFGFGWAVLGGFLLTASKNWVRIRGYHGSMLMFLAGAWWLERGGMWFAGALPVWLFDVSNNLFLGAIVVALLWTLLKYRKNDAFQDNYLFVLILPIFWVAKYLLLSPEHYLIGANMAVGLFRVALLVMLERTLSPFMRGAFQVEIWQFPPLNSAIKQLAFLLVFASFIPTALAGTLALLLAVVLLVRLRYWKPLLAVQRLDVGIMYLGYLAIVAQLLLEGGRLTLFPTWTTSLSTHVFTLGAMGLIVPAMLIRISQGHTGRKIHFNALDKLALRLMIAAWGFRILAPKLDADHYIVWLAIAAACWFGSFALLGWRYFPMLMQPRVDGKAT